VNEKIGKTVFRLYWAWNDDKEERWLRRMAQAGWHLVRPRGFFYRFEKGDPADIVFRLDYQGPSKSDRREYLGLFKDAGWEHVAEFSNWHYFRIAAGDGPAPEIHTDVESRIAKYRRLLGLLAIIMLAVWVPVLTSHPEKQHPLLFWGIVRGLQVTCAIFMGYAIIRLGLKIRRLSKGRPERMG